MSVVIVKDTPTEGNIMSQLDHLLDGRVRERCQEITQQIKRYELARKIKNPKRNHKAIVPLRAILVALINLVVKSF